jgi:hypothetical protein
MLCPRCGTAAGENDYACTNCTAVLRPPAPLAAPPTETAAESPGTLGGLIPTRNRPALVGYYLAVFAAIPLVGWLFGIPAVILGWKGVQTARRNPAARGGAHAWFAVVAGGVFTVVYLALTVFLVAASLRD